MSKMATFKRIWKTNKRDLIVVLYNKIAGKGCFNWMSDESYLKMTYFVRFGKKLNLSFPETFNEKLNWLKLYDRKDIYTRMVDKYEAKLLVKEKIGEEYIVPTYGIYESIDDIDFNAFPDQFVIKCTHDSGSVIICRDKENFDFLQMKKKINHGLSRNLFFWAREWPYKNVKPRIIVEQFLRGIEDNLLVYKVFCFHGIPRIIQVIQNDKHDNETIDYFDTDWNLLELRQDFPNSTLHIQKPELLEEMLRLSSQFITDRPFIRVDWYIVNGKLIFSEFTFFSDAGFAYFTPSSWDKKLGDYMDLKGIEA